MILAAGLGTRMRPLSELRAKPAMPVRGVPAIGYTMALLARHGVRELIVNLHHLPETVRDAVERHVPEGLEIHYSHEEALLGTGGGIRKVADFLRESDPSIVLAGDMIVDLDLTAAAAAHRDRGDRCTLLLRNDPRAASFGTIGVDAQDRVRRIGRRFDLGGEQRAGLFFGVRILSPRALRGWPECESFEDLSDWLAPALAAGAPDIGGVILEPAECVWEPVGTPMEYLQANLHPPALSYADTVVTSPGTRIVRGDQILGAGAEIAAGAHLERVVVWEGERVPASLDASDGVYAAGRFFDCREGDSR